MRLFLMRPCAFSNPLFFAAGLSLVSQSRRAKVLRHASQDAQWSSLAAGLLLAYGLTVLGKTPAKAHPTQRHPWTKPFCAGCPDIHFSLSHQPGYAVCLIGPHPCGVDIESRLSAAQLPRRTFHAEELAFLSSLSQEEQPAMMLRLWTRKEALLKAVGTGISVPPASLCVLDGQALTAPRLPDDRTEQDFPASGSAGHCILSPDTPLALHDYQTEEFSCAACLPAAVPFPRMETLSVEEMLGRLQDAGDLSRHPQAETGASR